MNKDNFTTLIQSSIIISATVTLFYILYQNDLKLSVFIKGVSMSITITTLFWTFYFTYGWKLRYIGTLFYRPNLNGTWKGYITSDWRNENGDTIEPKEIFIVIRQSFIRIHFTTLTDTFVGSSYSETLNLKKAIGLKNVVYLYRKETSQKNDEDLREGATELRLIVGENCKQLNGKYWTNTKTQGTIEVQHVSNEYVDSYKFAKELCEKLSS